MASIQVDSAQNLNAQQTANALDEAPAMKKRKTRKSEGAASRDTKRKGKAKAGRLIFILEAPMEIVFEIMGQLHPIDILHLSEVNKELHSKLTSLASDSVWAAARQNVPGLPECPPDFTESAYARFVFGKTCDGCGCRAMGQDGMAFVRMRLCGKCQKKLCTGTSSEDEVLRSFGLLQLLPSCGPNDAHHRFAKTIASRSTLKAILQKLRSFDSREEEKAYRQERSDYIKTITDHAWKLDSWLKETKKTARDATEHVRELRREAISSRLLALGHEQIDINNHRVVDHPSVRQPVELTERSWANIRSELEELVEEAKAERLERIHKAQSQTLIWPLFKQLWETLPSDLDKYTYIPYRDFLGLRTVVRLCSSEVSHEELPTRFEDELGAIKLEVEEFRAMMRKELACEVAHRGKARRRNFTASLPEALEIAASVLSLLSLATSVFKTYSTATGLSPPIHYTTLFQRPLALYGQTSGTQPLLTKEWFHYKFILEYDPEGSRAMRRIVAMAGLDHRMTTMEDLETLSSEHAGPFKDKSWQDIYLDMFPHAQAAPAPQPVQPVQIPVFATAADSDDDSDDDSDSDDDNSDN